MIIVGMGLHFSKIMVSTLAYFVSWKVNSRVLWKVIRSFWCLSVSYNTFRHSNRLKDWLKFLHLPCFKNKFSMQTHNFLSHSLSNWPPLNILFVTLNQSWWIVFILGIGTWFLCMQPNYVEHMNIPIKVQLCCFYPN